MKKGTVIVDFTIGFGNNLFQYTYGKILSEISGCNLHHPALEPLGIKEQVADYDANLKTVLINDANSLHALKAPRPDVNYFVHGYFENYKIYTPHLKKIKNWFPRTAVKNKKDLILHFRLQNRLVQQTHCKNHVSFDAFARGIEKFEFEKLHIVTDAKKWDFYTNSDIEEIQDEISCGPNPATRSPWVSTQQSVDYMNHLIEGFSKYQVIAHCNDAPTIPGSGGLRDDFINDFNLMRSFDKIMFKDSTFSWWAALLSDATQVSPFGPWKPNKGTSNKNLGQANFPGWSPWGSFEDLINEK